MQFWALTVDSFRQSLDRKIFWVLVVITLLVTVTMASIGIEPSKVTFLFGSWEVDTAYFTIVAGATGSAEGPAKTHGNRPPPAWSRRDAAAHSS